MDAVFYGNSDINGIQPIIYCLSGQAGFGLWMLSPKRTGRKSPGGSYVPPGTQEGGMTYDGRISKREKGDGDIRSWPDNPMEVGESGQDTGNKLEWEEDVLPGGCNTDGRQGE